MAKFNWSKSGNYTADPARYQRGDDACAPVKQDRPRQESGGEGLKLYPHAAKKDVKPKRPLPRKRRLTEIEKCQAIDRMYNERWKNNPEGKRMSVPSTKEFFRKLRETRVWEDQPANDLQDQLPKRKKRKKSSKARGSYPDRK